MKKHLNKGEITIEASLVFFIFVVAYITINSLAVGLMNESLTRKAIFETGIEFSNYIQMIDKVYNIKTKSFDTENYKEIFLDSMKEQLPDSNITEIFSRLKTNILNDTTEASKKIILKNILKDMLLEKIEYINYKFKTDNLIDLDIENLKIHESGSEIEFVLSYSYKLDKFGLFTFNNDVSQKFLINTNMYKKNQKNNNTIWSKSNFERGRYFASKFRNEKKVGLKPGYGIDIYDSSNNSVIQIFSLNIFADSYTQKNGNNYILKEKFFTQIDKYYEELLTNSRNIIGRDVVTVNDEIINIKNARPILYIVMPLESQNMNHIQKDLSKLSEKETNIEFYYIEEALSD